MKKIPLLIVVAYGVSLILGPLLPRCIPPGSLVTSLQRKPAGTGGRVHSDWSQYEAARRPLTASSPSGTGAEVSLGLAGCWEGEVLRGSTAGHSVNRGCDRYNLWRERDRGGWKHLTWLLNLRGHGFAGSEPTRGCVFSSGIHPPGQPQQALREGAPAAHVLPGKW